VRGARAALEAPADGHRAQEVPRRLGEARREDLDSPPNLSSEALVDLDHVREVADARFEDEVADAELGERSDLANKGFRVVPGRHPEARAERERFEVAPRRAARRRQLCEPALQLLGARERGVPSVAELGHAPESPRRVTADPDGDGAARGLRGEAEGVEAHERAPEARALLPPARLHDPERLVAPRAADRKSTRLNSSHGSISYAVFCLKKKKKAHNHQTTL